MLTFITTHASCTVNHLRQCRDDLQRQKSALKALRERAASLQQQLTEGEQSVKAVEDSIDMLKQQVKEHEAELGTQLHANLTAQERKELEQLQPQLKKMQVGVCESGL